MRHALALALAAALLSGCASHKPEDYNGIWINQQAIDAAAKGVSLRKALQDSGGNLEWKVNVAAEQASYTNGFEIVEGQLKAGEKQRDVVFPGNEIQTLSLDGDELVQHATPMAPQHSFQKASSPAPMEARTGTTFEQALYGAYLKGDWKVIEGPGQGNVVRFGDTGSVEGLPNLDRYALCLAGDCASMSGEYDSLWLERNQQGNPWIFKRDGKTLEILRALNSAQPDEMPQLYPGARQWLLERD
ncbi:MULTISPECIES: hypothetical protein [Pseudomonas]|jgi:hypothetical protein|uniref:Lipoprotein n=1 Tax=Pseudomonas qingdaonensis TaxID=2056231 RepID=A0ABX8DRK4_9PSED|nr:MULTISPECIES: hypothetical protein [Pseudomonas]KIU51912.1 lipoprotein [Pseudomonas putida]KTC17595.1 hypothetical protein AO392_09385 [Pseudomonas putida]MBG8558379.1 hypothetical protein [Pseudomonas qingdaonensis]MCO7505015.1 hypothetical protein [Pseudomonas sp. VE 267-6A]MCO7529927.1 hypothetical protein [Pseudomonas sp. 2]